MSSQHLSIRVRLIGAFAALAMLLLGLGFVGLTGMRTINDYLVDVSMNWLPSVRTAEALNSGPTRHGLDVYRRIAAADGTVAAALDAAIEQHRASVDRMVRIYRTLIKSPEEQALFDRFSQEWDGYVGEVDRVLALSRKHDAAAARTLMEQTANPRRLAVEALAGQIVEMNQDGVAAVQGHAIAAYEQGRMVTLAASLGGLLLATGLAVLLIRSIARGIASVVRPMTALAAGDVTVAIPHQGMKTEIGGIADAVQVFKDGLIRMRKLEQETMLARAGAEVQRKQAMRDMADGFETAVGGIVGMVGSAAAELQTTAQTMTNTAQETATQSAAVAAAAEEAASNVGTVAAAAEELGSSVQEIGRQVQGSATLAEVAVRESAQTASLVQELNAATGRIGDVVKLISDIAGQTNLLALNATIEAARAGEAGRGFAVVASEVKELAGQTARATEEIGSQIARIQGATGQSVRAIEAISARIGEINDMSAAIAAAVEQQGAATQEIVRNVAQAAMGTGEVTANIGGVAGAAEETGTAASRVLVSASDLSRQAENLGAEVRRFLATVRAA